MDRIKLAKSSNFFSKMNSIKNLFPGFALDLVRQLFNVASLVRYNPGEFLLHPGQAIRSMLLVRSGKVKLYREDKNGNEYFLFYLLPGQACASTILSDMLCVTSKISVKAVEKTEVWLVPQLEAQQMMLKHKSWNDYIIRNLQLHIHQLMQVLDFTVFKSMDERLEHYLETQCKTQESPCLQLSHQEIANDMSSSREVISRLLKKMEQKGKVKLYRSQIEVIS